MKNEQFKQRQHETYTWNTLAEMFLFPVVHMSPLPDIDMLSRVLHWCVTRAIIPQAKSATKTGWAGQDHTATTLGDVIRDTCPRFKRARDDDDDSEMIVFCVSSAIIQPGCGESGWILAFTDWNNHIFQSGLQTFRTRASMLLRNACWPFWARASMFNCVLEKGNVFLWF